MTGPPAPGADSPSAGADPPAAEGTPPRATLTLQTAGTEPGLRVSLTGDLDLETSVRFVTEVSAAFGKHQDVEIDLRGVAFLDVAGARALIEVRDQVLASGGRLTVVGLDEQRLPAARVLDLRRHLAGGAPGGADDRQP